jgi:hypothetical protein
MDPLQTSNEETRFLLWISSAGHALATPAETDLVLSDDGISYALDGRSGKRPYTGLTGIRLQLLSPTPWIVLAQLDFLKGRPLFVYSRRPGHETSRERDRDFVGFIGDLHRRLTLEDRARVAFRRGLSPLRHKIIIVCAAIFAAMPLTLLGLALAGKASLSAMFWPLFSSGLLAAGMANLVRTTWPGSYDPEHLPSDLVPRI